MKKTFTLIASLALYFSASATVRTVQVADFQFNPSSMPTVNVGDTIMWVWVNGSHTTTSTSVPTGAATWDQPLNSGSTSFSYKVTTPGTYIYHCTPHAPGMAGAFTVQASTSVPSSNASPLFSISPIPADKILHIESNEGSGLLSIAILDGLGRVVMSLNNDGRKSIEISTSKLANGIYILHASSNGQELSRSFQVQH